MNKKRITALLVSFAMIFSVIVTAPIRVFAEVMPVGLNKPFSLNGLGTVKATWSQKEQTLTITGNGKIDLVEWLKLAKKFSENNYKDSSNRGWNTNSDFTLKIADATVQLPDNTAYGNFQGFFQNFQGKIDIEKLNTSNVTNMNSFFYGVKTEEVDVSRFNTSNLKSISSMFENSNLREIDMSNWDMSKITDNKYVFYNTQNLEFLKFKKLPNETELKCFADNYFVDILRDDGVFAAILGPYDKNKKYTFKKNQSYRVYLANTSVPRVKRIFGNNRYQTAIKASQKLTNSSLTAFVASGESIIDALSASYVSAVSQAPILLTSKDSIDAETLEEIKRIGVHEAVIVGGVNVISENVENQLKNQGLTVSKISGSNRYDTAAEIANIASATLGLNQEKVFLCSGKTYADALSIAPVTAKENGIILLTDGHTLTEETKKFIKSGVRVKIIGGIGVISQDLENKIKSTGAHVERIYGKDRFETSLEVYKKYFNFDGLKTAYLANGITMVDALTGAALAKKDGTGILLARSDKMITAMKEDVIKGLKRLRVLGGTAVIQDNIWIKGYLEDMNPLFGN